MQQNLQNKLYNKKTLQNHTHAPEFTKQKTLQTLYTQTMHQTLHTTLQHTLQHHQHAPEITNNFTNALYKAIKHTCTRIYNTCHHQLCTNNNKHATEFTNTTTHTQLYKTINMHQTLPTQLYNTLYNTIKHVPEFTKKKLTNKFTKP